MEHNKQIQSTQVGNYDIIDDYFYELFPSLKPMELPKKTIKFKRKIHESILRYQKRKNKLSEENDY